MMYAIANIQGNSFVRWLCKLQIHYTSRFLYKQIKKEILTNWTNLCQKEKQKRVFYWLSALINLQNEKLSVDNKKEKCPTLKMNKQKKNYIVFFDERKLYCFVFVSYDMIWSYMRQFYHTIWSEVICVSSK